MSRFTRETSTGQIIKNTSSLTITLSKSVSTLDDVQIIAYGQTSKRFLVGNISTVKAADIERQPVSNPLLALQGRVPGLFITQANRDTWRRSNCTYSGAE